MYMITITKIEHVQYKVSAEYVAQLAQSLGSVWSV